MTSDTNQTAYWIGLPIDESSFFNKMRWYHLCWYEFFKSISIQTVILCAVLWFALWNVFCIVTFVLLFFLPENMSCPSQLIHKIIKQGWWPVLSCYHFADSLSPRYYLFILSTDINIKAYFKLYPLSGRLVEMFYICFYNERRVKPPTFSILVYSEAWNTHVTKMFWN